MALNVVQKLIKNHLAEGNMTAGEEIGLKIDQTLCQDATGTLVMLELEAIGLKWVHTELSAQYVDHNLIQEDYKNADDHIFLQSAASRFGLWFSPAGNGVSHPLHMTYFGKPGKTLLGSDSHTCASGAIGMLAIGAGGLEVAMAMAGYPYPVTMPKVIGIKLTGEMPDWISAKDIVLEMLRRRGVKGAVNCVIEYYGDGLKNLSIWDRHVIANMGAEMGATGSVFPSDDVTKAFFELIERADDWQELQADDQAAYDLTDEIDLSTLEPLIALPSSPGKVVHISEAEGQEIYQAYVGSSANPGFRDFAIAAEIAKNKQIDPKVSFDINPSARHILEELANTGALSDLIHSGARIHQAGCNGCIGMGQAPATDKISLRTVPRNFPGRSGTKDDKVFLCSPEVAAASALTGKITDPRKLGMTYPKVRAPKKAIVNKKMFVPPREKASDAPALRKGPNISSIPEFPPFPKNLSLPVILKVDDNVSTDEIMPAGARVLPYRSNIPRISDFVFDVIDESYPTRAKETQSAGQDHIIIGGENYGQGSSREHAAIAPRYLGLRVVIAKSFARIHWENLINFGILPLTFENPDDYEKLEPGDILEFKNVTEHLREHKRINAQVKNKNLEIIFEHRLTQRQIDVLQAGGLINWAKEHPLK